MNTFFDDIASALSTVTSWDDLATGALCVTFCAASVSLFMLMFAGAM